MKHSIADLETLLERDMVKLPLMTRSLVAEWAVFPKLSVKVSMPTKISS